MEGAGWGDSRVDIASQVKNEGMLEEGAYTCSLKDKLFAIRIHVGPL